MLRSRHGSGGQGVFDAPQIFCGKVGKQGGGWEGGVLLVRVAAADDDNGSN